MTTKRQRLLYYYYPIFTSYDYYYQQNHTGRADYAAEENTQREGFAHAKAVMFEERGSEVVITPMRAGKSSVESDHLAFVEYTMRDWLDPENDNLFKLPKNL